MNDKQMTAEEFNQFTSQVNVEALYKANAEKIVDEQLRNIANEAASREPLPSIVESALGSNKRVIETSVGKVEVRKMVAVDITIFKLTDSPFYKLIMGGIKEDGTDAIKQLFPDEELLYGVVYQFTHPVKAVYQLVKKGKEAYHEAVMEEMLTKGYTAKDLMELVQHILEYIGIVNKAQVEFAVPEDDKKK